MIFEYNMKFTELIHDHKIIIIIRPLMVNPRYPVIFVIIMI